MIILTGYETSALYHTKEYKGTTMRLAKPLREQLLYHTKEYKGTTIACITSLSCGRLYHTKEYKGTTMIAPGE